MSNALINLLNFDYKGLKEFVQSCGEPSFRAQQLTKWIHHYGVSDFNNMSDISKKFRAQLSEMACVTAPEVLKKQCSKDGTIKWLFKLECGNCIETVYIPEETRGTLCVSSQVGCGLNCRFCATGAQGFNRDLSLAEIIGQVWYVVRDLSIESGRHDRKVTNVVMMGMGEPLLNFDNVVSAMSIMMDDLAYGLAKRRVTLSTSGLIPQMQALSEVSDCALAVSLHAPNNPLRDELVPINKKYPLSELMDACRSHFKSDTNRKITFEYVMLNGVNDSLEHAHELINLLTGIPAKLNLIPFNPFPGTEYTCSPLKTIEAFQTFMLKSGMNTIIRKTRGEDINAACGQLAGNFKDRTNRRERMARSIQSGDIIHA